MLQVLRLLVRFSLLSLLNLIIRFLIGILYCDKRLELGRREYESIEVLSVESRDINMKRFFSTDRACQLIQGDRDLLLGTARYRARRCQVQRVIRVREGYFTAVQGDRS